MPPSHQQHGQQDTGGRARGRSYTSATSRGRSFGALHPPGEAERENVRGTFKTFLQGHFKTFPHLLLKKSHFRLNLQSNFLLFSPQLLILE